MDTTTDPAGEPTPSTSERPIIEDLEVALAELETLDPADAPALAEAVAAHLAQRLDPPSDGRPTA